MQIDAFLADSVVQADGKLFALGAGWDRLNVQSFPARHSRLSLGILVTLPFTDETVAQELTIRFEDADGKVLTFGGQPPEPGAPDNRPRQITARLPQTSLDEDAPGDERTITMAVNLDGLVFDAPGRYRFVIEMPGFPQKRLGFRVAQVGG